MTTASDNNPDREPTENQDESELDASSQQSPSGEPCIYCPTGHFEPGTTTITLERKGTTLVVKQVPAEVCWACGEALLAEETVDELQDMMKRAVDAELETAVRSYGTENEQSSTETDTSQAQEEAFPRE